MQEYISNIDFSLNFEDIKSSVRVHVGDIVFYDGMIARYKKSSGEEISGKTSSLRSAIASNWLTLNVIGSTPGSVDVRAEKVRNGVTLNVSSNKMSDHVPHQAPQYDRTKGGDFDQYLETDSGTKVVSEKDRIVKKFEVAGDQVAVKDVTEATEVTSSTAALKNPKSHSTKVIKSEHYNAESSRPIKSRTASAPEQKKTNSFTVDDTTPRITEDATLKEITRVTKPVVEAAESQDAKVIKKISKVKVQVEETEGITLNSEVGSAEKEIDFSVKTSSGDTPVDTSVKVSSGSTPVADLTGQEQSKGSKYIDQLPSDWSKMHWVKKEQFIKTLTDIEFVKFILTVEPVKAVQNACRKRLVELEKLEMQK
jgi:hypothetical protein